MVSVSVVIRLWANAMATVRTLFTCYILVRCGRCGLRYIVACLFRVVGCYCGLVILVRC